MNCVKWPCGADQHPAQAGLILSLAFNGAKIGADALFGSLARLAPVAQISDGVAYRFAPETRGGGAGPAEMLFNRAKQIHIVFLQESSYYVGIILSKGNSYLSR